ncbi:MAG: flagellar biosynthesis protein FlhB [Deltaproteobacteria bacterium]|nr:flagellar biosynthesis protein FlhB [Deltaproteobacteria bacterium]
MGGGSDQEKTEQPTGKKLAKAREEGQVAVSKEVPSVLILLFSLCVFFFAGSWMFDRLINFMKGLLQNIGVVSIGVMSLRLLLFSVFKEIIIILAPLMGAVVLAGVIGHVAQFGFLFTGKPLTPKFSKMDPVKGMKKLFSLKSYVELVKMLIKTGVVGGVAFIMLRGEADKFPLLIRMEVWEILIFIGQVSFKICFYTCIALIILAALDFAFQKWQHVKGLKMTKQEVKDEAKQSEGDPKIKSRIRSAQMEMARRRMMEAVHEADVIITNPTRLAIALQFDAKKMTAPKVTAKGSGFVAERIRAIAMEHSIPIVEEKPLAQTLYKTVEIDDLIPVSLYQAVAEVLAYVYRLKGITSNQA